ncbi:hypothetical protein [Pantoea sp. Acro-807]|uniref:hypothetical protein n=1 Tax=Pantoea sp. Acro-807 TaxID=2608356 RepID=UPI00141962BA|nr:hypothetical protein [Pantoea sp. Acro-807]NIE70311.1 hypothetical protein [Pantoea sp. Acro-807]
MSDILDTFVKVILPIILALVTVLSFFKEFFLTKKRIFEEREKLSKMCYDLYKINDDEGLKRLSIEYGYAAITKESFLSLQQRKALVQSENPTRDIELFVKCRGLLDIATEPLSFLWKQKRYASVIYFNLIIITRLLSFIFGLVIFMTPMLLLVIQPSQVVAKFNEIHAIGKIGLVMYAFFIGFFFAYANLVTAVRLIDAKKMIQRHATP